MEKLTLGQLSALVMAQAKEKGFGTKPEDIQVAEKIALIHSEVSEAFEAYRHNNMDGKDGFAEELSDANAAHLAPLRRTEYRCRSGTLTRIATGTGTI